jgi:prepilin-type N-terminal cleavage/methylation domain-containing protein
MNPGKSSHQAMTLMELVTVISVISVLAAIAVPNFLEAQVRSKVARTHVDLASLGMALRAYQSDWGQYPPNHPRIQQDLDRLAKRPLGMTTTTLITTDGEADGFTGKSDDGKPTARQVFYGPTLARLTTPLAYMGEIPKDTFGTYRYPNPPVSLILTGIPAGQRTAGYGFAPPFLLLSAGPSLRIQPINPSNGTITIYDPTNGTISHGVIGNAGGQTLRRGFPTEREKPHRPGQVRGGTASGGPPEWQGEF